MNHLLRPFVLLLSPSKYYGELRALSWVLAALYSVLFLVCSRLFSLPLISHIFQEEFSSLPEERMTALHARLPAALREEALTSGVLSIALLVSTAFLLLWFARYLGMRLTMMQALNTTAPFLFVYAAGQMVGLLLLETNVVQFDHVISFNTSLGLSLLFEVQDASFQLHHIARLLNGFTLYGLAVVHIGLKVVGSLSSRQSLGFISGLLILFLSSYLLFIQVMESSQPGSYSGDFQVR